ncbi:MAG: TRZ/ATZ family hydrolase [Pseudomonadota bacterium]
MNTAIETVIHPGWIVPILPHAAVLSDHSIAVSAGKISAILPRADAKQLGGAEHFDLPDHALMPGLINVHGHAAMSLLRGFADDQPLMPWLEDHIWPAEAAHVSYEFVRDGVDLATMEMIRSGTTTFSDMYFFPEACADAVQQSGLRCQMSIPIIGFPTAWAGGADECISKGLALRDDRKHQQRLSVMFGPHAIYTVPEPALARVSTLAAELDLPIQVHLHETAGEVLQAVEERGERPLDTLHRLGLIGPRSQCVHMTDLGAQDIALLAESGAHVIHCPHSNMKLASGACPVHKLAKAGVNVALGTDSAASNNNLNLFQEMHTAALLAKLINEDATALPAEDVLAMATLNGARALGLDHLIGSLEPGKCADMIAVDLSGPEVQPLYNPLSQLAYACNGSQVTHSWVDGQLLMADRRLQTLNESSVIARTREWQRRIMAHA